MNEFIGFWKSLLCIVRFMTKFSKQRQICSHNMCMKVKNWITFLERVSIDCEWKKTKKDFIRDNKIIKNENN
jgi:hypothetical protein